MSKQQYELREQDIQGFIRVPAFAYPEVEHYVNPMASDLHRMLNFNENPLFKNFGCGTFFVVYKDGQPLGRIVAHAHQESNKQHGLRRAYFGFFDCANDPIAAQCLLKAAENWARTQGFDEIIGNFNLTAMQQIGVLTGGYENQPYTDQMYNPPHIPRLLQNAGYVSSFPMQTFEIDVGKAMANLGGDLQPSGTASLRAVGRWHLRRSMEAARQILNDGFAQNPMFVGVTPEEYFFQAKDMMWVLDPRLSVLAFVDDRPVGVVVCIPDLNPLIKAINQSFSILSPWHYLQYRRRRTRAVIIYYSVCRDMHGQGLMKWMLARTLRALHEAGYRSVGVTWIADTNKASLRQMERLGARKLHDLHLFGKSLMLRDKE